MPALSSQRITVSEIAQIAGVTTSAVSNWRARYHDFPAPVETLPGGDLFELSSIVTWLELRGRDTNVALPSLDRQLWTAVEFLRGTLAFDDAVLVILQVLFVHRATRGRQSRKKSRVPNLRDLLSAGGDGRSAWEGVVAELAHDSPDLSRILRLPVGIADSALREIVERILDLPLANTDWGTVTSAFLKRAQGSLSTRSGSTSTPGPIANLIVQLLAPVTGVVYDPAAGNAMVLAEAAQQRTIGATRFVGQEVLESSWRIGYLHMAMQGVDFQLAAGDTLREDRFPSLRANRIALEPPVGQKFDVHQAFNDERWQFGTTSSSEWMWAQHLLFHLSDSGVGVMSVPTGTLSRIGRDSDIRRRILLADLLDAAIELPPGLIPGTSAATAILVFSRDRASRPHKVLFVDARQLGVIRRGKASELRMEDIERLAATLARWRTGRLREEPLFSAIANTAEVVEAGADLSVSRFVRYVAPVEMRDFADEVAVVENLAVHAQETLNVLSEWPSAVSRATERLLPEANPRWHRAKLGDLLVAPLQIGARQESSEDQRVEGEAGHPWIATRLVTAGEGRLAHLPVDRTSRFKGRLARRGDLLLASRGIDKRSRISCATVDFDGLAAFAESLILLSPDQTKVHPDYLRLALTSEAGHTALAGATTGTVIGNLRREALAQVEILLPDLKTQARIIEAIVPLERAVTSASVALTVSRELYEALRNQVAVGHYGPPELED